MTFTRENLTDENGSHMIKEAGLGREFEGGRIGAMGLDFQIQLQ